MTPQELEAEIQRLRKKVANLQSLVRQGCNDWPNCPGCGHADEEGHKADCLLRSEHFLGEPTWRAGQYT